MKYSKEQVLKDFLVYNASPKYEKELVEEIEVKECVIDLCDVVEELDWGFYGNDHNYFLTFPMKEEVLNRVFNTINDTPDLNRCCFLADSEREQMHFLSCRRKKILEDRTVFTFLQVDTESGNVIIYYWILLHEKYSTKIIALV